MLDDLDIQRFSLVTKLLLEKEENLYKKQRKLTDSEYCFYKQYLKTLRKIDRVSHKKEEITKLVDEYKSAKSVVYHNPHQYESDKGRLKAIKDILENIERVD